MNTGQTQWTGAKLAQALKLRADGHPASVIARIMAGGLTRNAVIGRLHRADVASGDRPPAIRVKVKREKPHREPPPKGIDPNSVTVALLLDEPVPMGRVGEMVERGCKFIHGDPLTPGYQYCGHPTERSYCTFHHKLMYTGIPKQVRRYKTGTRANQSAVNLW